MGAVPAVALGSPPSERTSAAETVALAPLPVALPTLHALEKLATP